MKAEVYSKNKYFEAVIQLRPYDEEVVRFIENQIKKRKNVFISNVIKLKSGIDLYISSQKFARTLGAKLKKTFKGEMKITKTLHTRDKLKSKDLYRATILFRLQRN
ncbi:MAG: NMD3-related protein [Nanoarchaeota archaeon]|nr:NMD3-related protein [Nanoarchaeota archaeon]